MVRPNNGAVKLCCLVLCCAYVPTRPIQFCDDALQKLAEHQITSSTWLHGVPSKPSDAALQKQHENQRNTFINLVALLYAITKIYKRYAVIGVADAQRSAIQRLMYRSYQLVSPSMLQQVAAQSSFCVDVIGIAVETLLYKILCKLVITCCTRDISDIVGDCCAWTKHMFKTLWIV